MADHMESTLKVYIYNRIEILFFHCRKQTIPGNSRIIYQYVNCFKIFLDLSSNFFRFRKI